MKEGLVPGFTHRFSYTVPVTKTVPHLYPESPDFQAMPEVFATGFMVGLMEWACCDAMRPFLEEGEGSLGTAIYVTHTAATPPGATVTVTVRCTAVDGRRVVWEVEAEDGLDNIGKGSHERMVVRWNGFLARVENKKQRLSELADGVPV